ncbi:MAG: JAB domain-containing protein, partial [Panacagrimonas sp.]
IMGSSDHYHGSVHTAQVRIGELFREAIRANAAAIAVVHNHPSGDPMPSAADIQMTRSLVEAGNLLDFDVLDHIVIAGGRFASMRNLGLGFPKDR